MIIKKIIKEVSIIKLLLTIGMILLYSILSASSSILMTDAISAILDMNIQNFFNLSIIYIFFWIGSSLLNALSTITIEKLTQNFAMKLRDLAIESYKMDKKKNINSIIEPLYINFISVDVKKIEEGFRAIFLIVSDLLISIFCVLILIYFDYRLLIAVIFLGAFLFVIPNLFSNKLSDNMATVSDSYENLVDVSTSWLNGGKNLIYANSLSILNKKIGEKSQHLSAKEINQVTTKVQFETTVTLVNVISQVILFLVTGYLAFNNQIPFALIMTIGNISGQLFSSLSSAITHIGLFNETKVLLNKNARFFKEEDTNVISNQELCFNNISLSNVGIEFNSNLITFPSFVIEKGKKYAVIGESGKGKTTLLRLITKELDNYMGEIKIGNVDYRDISSEVLLSHFALINQEGYIFNTTIKENIILDRPFDETKYNNVLRMTKLLPILKQLEKQDNTLLNINKQLLSGGQLQRILISRAIYQDKKFIIMDEATSKLDLENAIEIEQSILGIPNITILLVTHRLTDEVKNKIDMVIDLNSRLA